MGYSPQRIDAAAVALTKRLPGLNLDVARAWVTAEQGVNNNVLGVTYNDKTGQHLYSYGTLTEGVNAAANLILKSPNYSGIRASLRGTPAQQARAIITSPWNAPNHYPNAAGLQTIAGRVETMHPQTTPTITTDTTSHPQSNYPSQGSQTGVQSHPQGNYPGHGGTAPQSPQLPAWGGLVSYPVGHVLTQQDVQDIMDKLQGPGGYFGKGPTDQQAAGITQSILESHVGQTWNKGLQDTLQQELMGSAAAAVAIPNQIAAIPGQLLDTAAFFANPVRLLMIVGGFLLIAAGGFVVLRGTPVPHA